VKAHIFSEEENWWRGFLYDKDCRSDVVRWALSPGVATTRNEDAETVAKAREQCRTVVTSNGVDFLRYINEAQKRDDNRNCEDCWGLVILPNKDLELEYSLKRANVRMGVWVGGRMIPWKAVGYVNLCIRLDREGKVHIARFERCKYCQGVNPIQEEWYRKLPVR
jgi:hypothetical protein